MTTSGSSQKAILHKQRDYPSMPMAPLSSSLYFQLLGPNQFAKSVRATNSPLYSKLLNSGINFPNQGLLCTW